MEPFGKF